MRKRTGFGPAVTLVMLLPASCDLWVSAEPVTDGPCAPGTSFVVEVDPQGYRREWCERRGDPEGPVAQGPWLSWHPSGLKAAEGEMRNGRQVGRWTFWDEQGDVIEIIDYPDPPHAPESD